MTQLSALSNQEFRQLEQQFKQIDQDDNGRLDRKELQTFLLQGGTDQEHCKQIIDEIFAAGDDDYDGYIDLNEFIELYLEIKNKLVSKQGEIIQELNKLNQERDMVHADFKRGNFSQRPHGLQKGNFGLTVKSGSMFPNSGQHLVVIQQGGQTRQTNPVMGASPQYQQHFDIQILDDSQPVVISVFNTQNRLIGRTQISFYNSEWDIRVRSDQYQTLNLGPDGSMNTPQLQVNAFYQEEDFARLERKAHEIQEQLEQNNNTLVQVNDFLQALNAPFGFLGIGQKVDNLVDFHVEKNNNKPYVEQQRQMEKLFDQKARVVATRLGFEVIPWIKATYFVLYIQMVFCCLSMYYRADFVTATIVAIGFYLVDTLHKGLELTPQERKTFYNRMEKRFEVLMFGIVVSMVYDIVWFIMNNYSTDDGSPETGVKKFSLWMSYLSFLWRVILFLVLWKDQIDFERIAHQFETQYQQTTGGNQGLNPAY